MEEEALSIKDMTSRAAAEETKNIKLAIELYRKIIKSDKLNIYAYDHLMKIFRQVKDYKKELAIINSAIKAYEQFYKSQAMTRSKKISEISQKLNRSFGLTDKEGNNIYNPEPIARWKKRKANVEKKAG
jgi:tetratricopeptide (TPR) repeat protein